MGVCCTTTNKQNKPARKSKSAGPATPSFPRAQLNPDEPQNPEIQEEENPLVNPGEGGSASSAQKQSGDQPNSSKQTSSPSATKEEKVDAKDQQILAEAEAYQKRKTKQTYDLSPKVIRQIRIYNISSELPARPPYSGESEWQQILQLYFQKLNVTSLQPNLFGLSSKKTKDIEGHLEQVQMHRDIELMVKILNLRNRNWVREQILMSRKMASISPTSFDTLIVTRRYLQLKEHFNWFVWAVSFFYFQQHKIDQFFPSFQEKMKHEADTKDSARDPNKASYNITSSRSRQQNLIYQEIQSLFSQYKQLKLKLPSQISKKWTEGFTYQGVFIRMLPSGDSHFVKNEMKAFKYIENELKEVDQQQQSAPDANSANVSFYSHQNSFVGGGKQSIYNKLILPLLNAVECGGFFLFASPTIYIENFQDDDLSEIQEENPFASRLGEENVISPTAGADQTVMINEFVGTSKSKYLAQSEVGVNNRFGSETRPRGFTDRLKMGSRPRALTSIYGKAIHRVHSQMRERVRQRDSRREESRDRSYSFLQDNIEEIDDPQLKMMPLLKNITKQNVIPIIDFEDPTQTDLNFLLLHVYECVPSVGLVGGEDFSTVMMRIPSDATLPVSYIGKDLISNVTEVTVSEIKKNLHQKSKRRQLGVIQNSKVLTGLKGSSQINPQPMHNSPYSDFSDDSVQLESDFEFDGDFQRPEEDPAELFEAKSFSKHGFDVLIISNNIQNLYALQNIQNTPFQVNREGEVGEDAHRVNSNIVANKRAQALYLAREEESNFSGMFKCNQSEYIRSIVEFQVSVVEKQSQHDQGGYIVGPGKLTSGLAAKNLQFNKKSSILRKGGNVRPGGMFGVVDIDGMTEGGNTTDETSVQGNAIAVVQNSSSEFKLKFALINHAYDCSIEQVFMTSVSQVAKIMDTTDTVFNIQSLKDLLHRKGLNLRFEWLLLLKLKSQWNRELVMIHILLRVLKKIINEEVKLKAQFFTPNKPKPPNSIAPKSLADHRKNSAPKIKETKCDHFIGNQYDNFKDSLAFVSNTLLKRKFSKQKQVFDEALVGLFLLRLKVLPIATSMINSSKNTGKPWMKEAESNYLQSKQILEDIISVPSQNPAVYLNSLQTYFNVDMDSELLRQCRQDKYLFLSQLNQTPMSINHMTSVNLRNHKAYSLREFSYFMLAQQIQKAKTEEKFRLSHLTDRQDSVITANQHLRNNIFKKQIPSKSQKIAPAEDPLHNSFSRPETPTKLSGTIHEFGGRAMGGAPGSRESHTHQAVRFQGHNIITQDPLNSSSVTDKNKFTQPPDLKIGQPNMDSCVVSAHSAMQSQVLVKNAREVESRQMTPRQFNNIDEVDMREYQSPTKMAVNQELERQHNQVLALQSLENSNSPALMKSELVLPSILYKLNTKHKQLRTDPQFSFHHNKDLPQRCGQTKLLPYYHLPTSDELNTWVMYLENILQEVYSVEGTEQILLEALNYLALKLYFGEETPGFGGFGAVSERTSSPLIGSSRSLGGGFGGDAMGMNHDQFEKVCIKIKEIQQITLKCSPEVLVMTQIICGLNYEQKLEDSVFPIESEKSYLTALICLFHLIGDPRGRGNFSLPIHLFICWKLSLLSLSIENRKVHDSEFSEELFDAALNNLINHQQYFREHQNTKLTRVLEQQEKLNRENLLSNLNKESSIQVNPKREANFNSRRSNIGSNGLQVYRITSFEEELDREKKRKNRFDISRFSQQNAENLNETHNASPAEIHVQRVGMHAYKRSQVMGNTANINQILSNNLNEHKKMVGPKPAGMYPDRPQVPVSQSYQGGGFKHVLNSGSQGLFSNSKSHVHGIKEGPSSRPGDSESYHHLMTSGSQVQKGKARTNNNNLNSLLEANISDIDIVIDDHLEDKSDDTVERHSYQQEPGLLSSSMDYIKANFSADSLFTPEVPFVHWSIYRQGIQNVLSQQGQKLMKNPKQLNRFLAQMYKNTLFTAIDKKILYQWLTKFNPIMFQSGTQWRNNKIKQAVFFQTAQMISSRSSSKSFQKNESEYSLNLSVQGSMMSQGVPYSYRSSKTQNLGSYSSIINNENGSINKGDIPGVLYSWGSDSQGQLGQDSVAHMTQKPVVQKIFYPRMISVLKDEFIKDVCCGYQHTLALTINGHVYSWGSNESCQLGLGPRAPDFVRKPKQISNLRDIVKLSAGNEHSCALNKNQEIFSWGSQFQTGQNDYQNRHTPKRMDYFKHIKVQNVACGGLHTLVLTKTNILYCWGSTEGGQLGIPFTKIASLVRGEENAVKIPQKIETMVGRNVVQIACGETHSICLTKEGQIWGWGLSMYGQLGLGFSSDSFEPGMGMEKSKVPEPRELEYLREENISKIFCGSTFSLFLNKQGDVFGCGMNDLGQLGEDVFNDLSALENARKGQIQTSDVTVPTQVSSLQGIQINTVACGEAHVLAIDGDGKDSRNMLWAWGQFKNGQLGLGEVSMKLNPRPVQNLASSKIHKIACGSAHSLALLGDPSGVTTLSPNYYAANEMLSNPWETAGLLDGPS